MGKMEAEKSKYPATPEIIGIIQGVRTVQDRGRIQIPKIIRTKMKLHDGDLVYWVECNDRFYIAKATQIGK